MDNQQESWFVFDLDAHTDPNFIEWLGSLGIIVKFNINGTRGAIAQVNEKLPCPVDLSCYFVEDLPVMDSGQALTDLIEQGKQTTAYSKRLIHSGNDNYGRSRPEEPKCSNPECWQKWEERCKEWDNLA